ncbi:uncharacterized protein ATC70_005551 [Mucor velutinosus]|uniref:BZIP domain-containing protein n=1 Tax=Mucor velutinosus TaxID=708070 RepID=A0AAN7DAG1_9FUNG|nr:hypothetical protein ATC70_005551 [Mucor velutinosus]
MDFEDIVDMEWLNSHTIDSSSLPSPPFIKDEDFNMDYQHSFSNQHIDTDQLVVQDAADAKDMMVMPTTEQIKQLIELAKRQLALREQLAASGGASNPIIAAEPTPEPESPPTTTISNCMLAAPMEPLIKIEDLYKSSSSSALDTTLSPSATTHSTSTLIPTTAPSATITTTTIASSTSPAAAAAADVTTTNIPDTVSPESLIKSEDTPLGNSKRECSHEAEVPISLEAYAETGGIDIKKLTSKERRQLRNKISARNFRVRRKEYITTLEGQVNDHKKANEQLLHRLNAVEEENKQLRMQLDSLKRQNHQLVGDTNLDKDLSILGSKASDTYRQDTSILVS